MSVNEELFRRYRGKKVLVDTNLLLLFLKGSFQRERILTFKRTARYTLQEYDLLSRLLAQFTCILTTPHILTEISNLANAPPEYVKLDWNIHFAENIGSLLEVMLPAVEITQQSAFNPFGLTDAAIQQASKDALLLTEDFRLAGYLRSVGVDTLNFRDLTLR